MSCPAGRPSSRTFEVKSPSGKASAEAEPNDGPETLERRTLDLHPRRPVGARPDHRGVGRDVAGLNAARDERPIGGAAEVRSGEAAETGHGACRGGADQPLTPAKLLFKPCLARIAIGIEAPSSNHDDGVPEQFECGPKVLRQVDDVERLGAVAGGSGNVARTTSQFGSANATISSLTLGVRMELPPAANTTYCLPLYCISPAKRRQARRPDASTAPLRSADRARAHASPSRLR